MNMLTVENLVKDFTTGFFMRKIRVLKNVTFNVNEGEIFGFIGPNGAGKTTTFKSILGFVSITSGNIKIGNGDNNQNIKKKIGYLPESPYFYDYLTGYELLKYMGELHGISKNILSKKIDFLLDKVNMDYARNMQLRKYSKGMLQRIGIAQSIINDPDFIILDEPMGGLDPIGRREVMDLILELKSKGKTILLSSHILSDVELMCDRIGVIIDGTVVKIGSLSELIHSIESEYKMIVNCRFDQIRDMLRNMDVKIAERAGFVTLKFDECLKQEVVSKIQNLNYDIISLYPLRKSLEGLFVEESKKLSS